MSVPTVTSELVEVAADFGLRRVSLGVQTLNPGVRAANAMPAIDAGDVHGAVEAVTRRDLFANLDLILGLEGESPESFLRGFAAVMVARPASVVVNVLQVPPGQEAGDPRRGASFVAEVAAGMRALAGAYHVYPHGREIESILFLSPEFHDALAGHFGDFARLASGVRAISVGTSTFAFGRQCESAVVPNFLIGNVAPNESSAAASDYYVNYKSIDEALRYGALLEGLAPDELELLGRLAIALAERYAAEHLEADFAQNGLRISFDDPEQPTARGEVTVSVGAAPPAFVRAGRFGINYRGTASRSVRRMVRIIAGALSARAR
jgi:hypothetical protein